MLTKMTLELFQLLSVLVIIDQLNDPTPSLLVGSNIRDEHVLFQIVFYTILTLVLIEEGAFCIHDLHPSCQ